jgi:2-isopropylmalate synthase
MEKIIKIFDTTLRDGEQSPGASMTIPQKVRLAVLLEKLGVDRIEAGFPFSSPIQYEGVCEIASVIKNSTVVALARCKTEDIDAAAKALQGAKMAMMHVFIATSPIHRQYKLRMSQEQILKRIEEMVAYARTFTELVEFSAEDATRTEREFLLEAIQTALASGASVINIPDTVGYTIPAEYGQLTRYLRQRILQFSTPGFDLSVHCHNDLGLAVANSLAAIDGGATQVEVTINGIGERAGNCSLEELVMAMKVRRDQIQADTNIKTEYLYKTSKTLQTITGLMIARNKPIFGDNVFSHEAGIHQDGVLKNRQTYEIMSPEHIGRSVETLVLGRHSGKHSFQEKLDEYEIDLTPEQFEAAFVKFSHLADLKKEIYDEDIFNIVSSILGTFKCGYELAYFYAYTGNKLIPSATIKITRGDEEFVAAETGDGPVDAVFKSIDSALGIKPRLAEFIIQAIGFGKDAQGQVKLQLEIDGSLFAGKGLSTDIIEASAFAYLNAINRSLFKNGKNHTKEKISKEKENHGKSNDHH